MPALGDIVRPVPGQPPVPSHPPVQAETVKAENKTSLNQLSPLKKVEVPEVKGPWQTLLIKLNGFRTMAPLIAAALRGSTGLSQNVILTRINELNQYHKDVALRVTKELWPSGNVPPSALAVVRKNITGNVIDFWEHNKTAKEPITADTAAKVFIASMPEIELHPEEIFEQQDQITLPVLTEASVGAAISAKLIKSLQEYPEPIKRLYLGQNSIPQIALAMSKDALNRSREIVATITVHKNLAIKDTNHKDVAYQSTLKTIGNLYESSIEMAATQINTKLLEVKARDKAGRADYMAEIGKHPKGQLYDNVTKKINSLVSIVYTQTQPAPNIKQSDNPGQSDDTREEPSRSPRR